jgi:hypothetical protein
VADFPKRIYRADTVHYQSPNAEDWKQLVVELQAVQGYLLQPEAKKMGPTIVAGPALKEEILVQFDGNADYVPEASLAPIVRSNDSKWVQGIGIEYSHDWNGGPIEIIGITGTNQVKRERIDAAPGGTVFSNKVWLFLTRIRNLTNRTEGSLKVKLVKKVGLIMMDEIKVDLINFYINGIDISSKCEVNDNGLIEYGDGSGELENMNNWMLIWR